MQKSQIVELDKPQSLPECTPQQILFGPPVDPKDRVKNYSEAQFEAFIEEWAFFYLKEFTDEYVKVGRFGGAGDKGRDIVGYVSLSDPVICDIFQCKHYKNPLTPTDIWLELAKLCYNTFNGSIAIPRRYLFVAPRDIGPKLAGLLEKPDELRTGLITEWSDESGSEAVAKRLVAGQIVSLKGKLLEYVEAFDFSRVHFKPIQEIIAEHGKTIRHAARFGGGLVKAMPPDKKPPTAPTPDEATYVRKLLHAYQDNLKDGIVDVASLGSHARFRRHFARSRERFYSAETLREFAKDSLPDGTTFEAVQDQVFDAVVDIAENEHPCGYTRVVEVTKTAVTVSVTNHPLGSYLKANNLMGICHQLANNERLTWVPDEQ